MGKKGTEKRDIRISSSLDCNVTHTKQDISISAHIKSHNLHIKKGSTSTVTYPPPGPWDHKSKIDLQNDFFMCIERAVTTGVAKG